MRRGRMNWREGSEIINSPNFNTALRYQTVIRKPKNGIRQEVALSDNKKTVSDKRARYQTNQNVIRQSPDSYQTTSSRVSDKLIKSKTGLPVSPIGQFWIPRVETGSPKRMSDRRWRVAGGPVWATNFWRRWSTTDTIWKTDTTINLKTNNAVL